MNDAEKTDPEVDAMQACLELLVAFDGPARGRILRFAIVHLEKQGGIAWPAPSDDVLEAWRVAAPALDKLSTQARVRVLAALAAVFDAEPRLRR
jgi:hypothetical protein